VSSGSQPEHSVRLPCQAAYRGRWGAPVNRESTIARVAAAPAARRLTAYLGSDNSRTRYFAASWRWSSVCWRQYLSTHAEIAAESVSRRTPRTS